MEPVAAPQPILAVQEIPRLEARDFEAVVRLHWPRVFRFVLASVRDHDAAQTLAQDCFLRAHQAWGRFRGDSSVQTWLMRIAVNLVRDYIRNRRLQFWRRTRDTAVEIGDASEWLADRQLSAESQVLVAEEVRAVWSAVGLFAGEAEDGFSIAFCGGYGIAGDRRGNGNERGNGEDAPVPGVAGGPCAVGEESMSEGLAAERVAKWLAGERGPADERHLAQCEQCSAELARMETAISGFRGDVRAWSARQAGGECPESLRFERARQARAARRVRWTLVAAALALLFAVPTWKDIRDKQRASETELADAALLEKVSYQLSQPVPAPLEPLQQMFVAQTAQDGSSGVNANSQLK